LERVYKAQNPELGIYCSKSFENKEMSPRGNGVPGGNKCKIPNPAEKCLKASSKKRRNIDSLALL